uniref:Uncharacterized protein n=1 Tax=Anguilla anguilla TaxID=7936 RepID=A0A0E9VC65_ANGAN
MAAVPSRGRRSLGGISEVKQS